MFIDVFIDLFQLLKFLGDFTAASILSVLVSLALESPIVVLEKIIFGPKRKPAIIPTTQRDEPTAPVQESTWNADWTKDLSALLMAHDKILIPDSLQKSLEMLKLFMWKINKNV